ncbi:hypothetical protein, partial [Vibrio parahaemolyticus]|uniref:hypothetical protein n=1 Tax=Vibrio parahaemolyticus TaxID=670 RepID=UPI0035BF737A
MKFLVPSWKALRVIGESNAVKLTILTPLFGYTILFSEKFQQWITLASSTIGVDSTQAASITLSNSYYLYFGLIALASASVLYNLASPSLTKEYRSNRDYVQENIDHITPSRLFGLSSFVERSYGVQEEKHEIFAKISQFESTLATLEKESIHCDSTLRILAIDLHNHFWNRTVYSRTTLRVTVTLLYGIGFSLLMVPTIK